MIRKGDMEWERLVAVWQSERKPSIIVMAGAHFNVFTPSGDEEPMFQPVSDQTLYSATSTGLAQSAHAEPAKAAPQKTPEAIPTKPSIKRTGRGRNA